MMLTDKERRVMMHLMWGATDRQIAVQTGMTINAVRVATKSIMRKLGVQNRTQAVMRALDHMMNGRAVHPGD